MGEMERKHYKNDIRAVRRILASPGHRYAFRETLQLNSRQSSAATKTNMRKNDLTTRPISAHEQLLIVTSVNRL